MSYNGWTNYETWNVGLWYGDVFADMASNASPQKLRGDDLESFVVEMEMDKIPDSSLAADIMNASLRRVNWDELADHYNEDSDFVDEDEEEEADA
jgi:hypothetical protein